MGFLNQVIFVTVYIVLVLGSAPTLAQVDPDAPYMPLQEPAFLVMTPDRLVQYSGGRVSIPCVAYGSPWPEIVWSSEGVSNYAALDSPSINIFTNNVTDPNTGAVLLLSILELCDTNYNDSLSVVRCTAVNSLSGNEDLPPLGPEWYDFSLRPMIYEPAALIDVPTQDDFRYVGNRFTVTCAAFGSPPPRVWFSSPTLDIADFSAVDSSAVNVFGEDLVSGNNVFVYSTLEVCTSENEFELFSRYLTDIQCHTENGVDTVSNFGIQSVEFRPLPFISIDCFSMTFNIKLLVVDVTFSAPYNPSIFGCFGDKIGFSDPVTGNYYSLRFPGECSSLTDTTVRLSVDTRDYRGFLVAGLGEGRGDSVRMALYTTSTELIPGALSLLPLIERDSTIPALQYVNNDDVNNEPILDAFDVVRAETSTLLYLHFDSIVQDDTFHPESLVLADSRGGGNSLFLSDATLPIPSLSRTICLQLIQVEHNMLQSTGICTSVDNCYLYFSFYNDTVRSHTTGTVAGPLPSSNAVQSSRVHTPASNLEDVFVQIAIQYVGCELVLNLPQNAPYIIRPDLDETISGISCFGPGTGARLNPKLYYNGQKIGNEFTWPTGVTYSVSEGINTANTLGLYTCTTYLDSFTTRHIFDTQNRVILLTGDEYSVEVLEPITIQLIFSASYDDNDFSLTGSSGSVPFEYTVEVVRNLAQFRINRTLLSISGNYTVVVGTTNVANVRITIRQPTVDISPAVISLLPEDDNTVLVQCTPSYNALNDYVYITRSDSLVEVTRGTSVSLSTVDRMGLEGVRISCLITDPSVNSPSLQNPAHILAQDSSLIRNVNETLSLNDLTGGSRVSVSNYDTIEVPSRFSAATVLECLGHIDSGNSYLYWSILKDGEAPYIPDMDVDNQFYTVLVGDNYITLTLKHAVDPFRGAVRCISGQSQEQITVFVVADDESSVVFCPPDNVDSDWRLTWRQTAVGASDGQRCPSINGKTTSGVIGRSCMAGGRWGAVDASACVTMGFSTVQEQAELFFEDDDYLDDTNYILRADQLSDTLNKEIRPGYDSLFPQDLQTSSSIVEGLVNSIRGTVPSIVHTYVADVFDNLLHANNTPGWVQLQTMLDRSSVRVLNSAEDYGVYLYDSLISNVVNASRIGNSERGYIIRDNIEFRIEVLPEVPVNNEDYQIGDFSSGQGAARILIPAELLRDQDTEGIVFAGYKNLNFFLPRDQTNFNFNTTTVIRSYLVSAQFQSNSSSSGQFPDDSPVEFEFQTLRTARVGNPRLVFWDRVEGIWSMEGILSTSEILENSEFKVFNVSGNSTHLTAFGVAVDVNEDVFQFTFPVWIGAGIVLVGSLLSIGGLLLSCMCDDVPRFFTVTFTVHISFIFSLICAFVAFLAGIELAIEHRLGCAATAGLLHYFFTASFTWLLFEAVLVNTFSFFATRWYWVFVFLIAGWGIPAIPTAITLGLLHPLYGTDTQCWFYFDGDISQEIVLGFMVPKIVLLGLTLILVVTGMLKNLYFAYKYYNKMQKSLRNPYSAMLWFLWMSVILLGLLLGGSWVFALLMVNVQFLDAETLGWIFMGLTAGLGVYIFFFSVVVLIINQKLDYERFFAKASAMVADPGGSDYRNLDVNKRAAARSSIIVPNPAFGEEGERSVVY